MQFLTSRAVTRYGALMQIVTRTYKSGNTVHQVDLGKVGKRRLRKSFDTLDEAEAYLKERRLQLRDHGHASMMLSEEDRIRFCAARDRLAAAGATIERAVDFYIAKHPPLRSGITMKRMLELCLIEKELADLRPRSLQQFKVSCGSFVTGREEVEPVSVTREAVQEWIVSGGWAANTQRTYLGDLRTLFAWGCDPSNRYLVDNPAKGKFRLKKQTEEEIASFSPKECKILLETALNGVDVREVRGRRREGKAWFRPLLGFATLAVFDGIRPAEISRSSRAEIDLAGKVFLVKGVHSKTRKTRPVDLSESAVAWLRLWMKLCPGQPADLIIPPNFKNTWVRLRRAAGLLHGWIHDILRHTFATMHFAVHKDPSTLKAEMGHSDDEDTLERHYRAVRTVSGKPVSRAMAKEFWGMMPPAVLTSFP